MGLNKVPKAFSKTPNPLRDTSTGIMNVPKSVRELPASGVDIRFSDGLKAGERGLRRVTSKRTTFRKLGRKEGENLSSYGSKKALRKLRN